MSKMPFTLNDNCFFFSYSDFFQREDKFWLGQLLNFTQRRYMKNEVVLYIDTVCGGYNNSCLPIKKSV